MDRRSKVFRGAARKGNRISDPLRKAPPVTRILIQLNPFQTANHYGESLALPSRRGLARLAAAF
jgi:hypothetical protein